MKKYLFLTLIPLVLLGASLSMVQFQRESLKRAVENYDRQLIVSLKQGDKGPMSQATTDVEALRIELFISTLTNEGKALDGKLISLDFDSVETSNGPFTDGPAELLENFQKQNGEDNKPTEKTSQNKIQSYGWVSARERWLYQYLNITDKSLLGQAEDVGYQSEYFLVKDANGWKVAGLKTKTQNG
jgi:hypothetical protein